MTLWAHENHTLNANRERVIDKRADLFLGRVCHKMRAWCFFKIEEILALRNVGRYDLVVAGPESFDKSEVSGARLPNIERLPLRIDS